MGIREELIGMVEETTCRAVSVKGESNLYADLGVDSLSFISLLLKVEERYGIVFQIMEMEQCLQVDRLVKLTESKVEGNRHDD